MSQASIKALITRFAGDYNTLSIQKPYIEFCGGSVEGGLLLSQILYWSDHTKDPEGWFYKSYKTWRSEIYLTQETVSKFVKRFVSAGFLQTQVKKVDGSPTLHYKVLWEEFTSRFLSFLSGENPDPVSFSAKPENSQTPEDTGFPQNQFSISAKPDIGFPQNQFSISAKPDEPLIYTSNNSSNKTSSKDARAENFDSQIFDGEFWEQEESSPVNSQESRSQVEADRDYRTEIKNVPGAAAGCGAETSVTGLTKIQPVDVLAQRFGCKSSADSDYARFKDVYQRLCNIVEANYGDHGKAQQAWQSMKDEFGGIPDRFWEGLEAFRRLSIATFGRKRDVILPGAAKWLNQQEWINALDREQIQREAAAAGVNMQASSAMLRKQQEHEEFRAMWQQAKAQIARRNQQPQGA